MQIKKIVWNFNNLSLFSIFPKPDGRWEEDHRAYPPQLSASGTAVLPGESLQRRTQGKIQENGVQLLQL